MMNMDNVYVLQKGQTYHLFTPQGEQIALLFMGYDGQYMKDLVALRPITKVMSRRWDLKPDRQN